MTNTQIGFVLCERMLSSGLSLPIEMWKSAASSYLAEKKQTPTQIRPRQSDRVSGSVGLKAF